jgi:CubicO group peptidase (beta-lactamase class C family)
MKNIIAFFSALFFIGALNAQNTPSFVKDSLDVYIQREMKNWDIPGAAVCIVKDGKIVAMKGYGVREKGKKEPVDENTLFIIASNTKAMTGTALAMLEAEGKCSLDDKVTKYLPDFKLKDPWVTSQLSLTDVLTHRIGMETFQGDFMYLDSDLDRKQIMHKMGLLTPVYGFRSKWGYCNAGFLLAGECIEKISGMSWEDFMRNRLFKPLGMTRTLALSKEILTAENKSAPHTLVNGKIEKIPYGEMDMLAPAGSVVSSVSDMSRWVIANLDSGRVQGKEIIPFKAIKRARKPESIVGNSRHPFNKSHYTLYGLGWMLEDYEGREIVSHTGGIHGFVTSVTLLPEENLGIIVLTNTDQNSFYQALKWEILDSYLNLPYRNYSNHSLQRTLKARAAEEKELANLSDSVRIFTAANKKLDYSGFTGKFVNEVYGNISITQQGKDLIMSFQHHPGLNAKLEVASKGKFIARFNNPVYGTTVMNYTADNGELKKFNLRVADFIEFTEYEFWRDAVNR